MTNVPEGDGPDIWAKFTTYDSATERLTLWHTISSWNDGGSMTGPYGVYTRRTVVSLPQF